MRPSLHGEEDLDGGPTRPVRFPRRRVGTCPQDMTMTLLADYGLRAPVWLPSAAIVALLGDFDVTSASARAAISRLARRGVLESARRGRRTSYRLTPFAAAGLAEGGAEIAGFTRQAEDWDGTWTIVAFSVPRSGDSRRRTLRGRLRWLGYAPLYDALWVSPHRLPAETSAALADIDVGTVTVFRARRAGSVGAVDRDPLQAWDLEGTAERYWSFLSRWVPLLPQVAEGRLTGPAALRARTEMIESYRQFVPLDPRVPLGLMPAGWPRARAREVLVAVYDGLARPAREHVSTTVARFTGGVPPRVLNHTVDDLLARVTPEPAGPGSAGP